MAQTKGQRALGAVLGNEVWFQTYKCVHAHTHSSNAYLVVDGMFCNTEPIRHTHKNVAQSI